MSRLVQMQRYMSGLCFKYTYVCIEEETDIREGNGRRCCLGDKIHSILCCAIQQQDDQEKRNRRTDAWQNGCFRKIDNHLAHTTPNHHPSKMDILLKTFLRIIHAANWLVRHSILSPKQQRRPLPSLLSVSSSSCNCMYI